MATSTRFGIASLIRNTLWVVGFWLFAWQPMIAHAQFVAPPTKGNCDPRFCHEFGNCLVDGGFGDISISPHTLKVGETLTITFNSQGGSNPAWPAILTGPPSTGGRGGRYIRWQNEMLCGGPGAYPTLERVGNCSGSSCQYRLTSAGSFGEDDDLGGRPWAIVRLEFGTALGLAWDEDYFGVIEEQDAPEADFSWEQSEENPLTVFFTGSISTDPDGSIESYEWDFGNDDTSDEVDPTYTYEEYGTYSVRLTVTDDDDLMDTAIQEVEVKPPTEMTYALTVEPDTVAIGEMVTVTLKVTNTGEATLTDIAPTGELMTESGADGGMAELTSGPDPETIAELEAGQMATITWEYETTEAGQVAFSVEAVTGKDPDGETVEGEADTTCEAGKAGAVQACTVQLEITGPSVIVNSIGDKAKANNRRGCDTGETIMRDGEDEAECTLRAAIQAVNAGEFDEAGKRMSGEPVIRFDIPNVESPYILIVGEDTNEPFPPITVPVIIEGATGGATIQLDGLILTAGSGLSLQGGNSTVKGLTITTFPEHGISISGGGDNTIVGNTIGTDITGLDGLGNKMNGIHVASGNNTIGGEGGSDGNTVSGNVGAGIVIASGAGNRILGNDIGTDTSGGVGASNGTDGIAVMGGASGTQIGGTVGGASGTGAGNTIVGNRRYGINVTGGASGTVMQGNLIQVNVDAGVRVDGASATLIGGLADDEGNRIDGNGIGVLVEGGVGPQIQSNRIIANSEGEGAVVVRGGQNTEVGTATPILGDAPGNTIEGPIVLEGGSNTRIQGNDIRNAFADVADGHGILIDGSANNLIGGDDPSVRNLIVGSGGGGGDCDDVQGGAGVAVLAGSARIEGNFIGTDGNGAIPNVVGVLIGTNGVSVNHNVISGNTCSGVLVRSSGGGDSGIRGNKIGTGQFGTDAVPNGRHGVEVRGGNVLIGGRRGEACDEFCNVIAGNEGAGIYFKNEDGNVGASNVIQGNYIGVNINGQPLGNRGSGIVLPAEAPVVVGGDTRAWVGACEGLCNVIAGNQGDGIQAINGGERFVNAGVFTGLVIQGNYIGLNPAGAAAGNQGHGIVIGGTPNDNMIGGQDRGVGNVIAYNQGTGVLLQGINTLNNASGNSAHGLGNTIRNNQIYGHRDPGIDLSTGVGVDVRSSGTRLASGDGHTPNDSDDLDDGPNGLQNTPDLLLAVRNGQAVEISGYVEVPDVIPGAYLIDIYANPACEEPGGFSEGQRPLIDTRTDASSISGSFSTSYFGLGNATTYLTATATHPDGSTSEFSQCLEVVDDDQVTEDDLDDDLFEGEGAQGEITSGHLAAKVQAERTLLITRFMRAPPGSVFFGTSARAPDGSDLLPQGVADGYWRLAGRALVPSSDFAFNLCLNTTGLLSEDDVQATVVIHRNTRTGGAWMPHDTHLETVDNAVYACADGLTGLGDFGFGLGTAAPFGEPTLTAPADGTKNVNERLDLRWEMLNGAASYDLQVALLPTFVSPMVDTTGLTTTSYVAGDLGGQTTHYWRVRGVDGSGTVGPWSAPFTFSTGATGVDIEEETLPEGFALLANYPNPFNPQTTIAFTLPQAAPVRLTVYDILGRQVAILRDGAFAAGRHEVTFDASGLPSGMYMYRLEAGSFVQTRRMLLLK